MLGLTVCALIEASCVDSNDLNKRVLSDLWQVKRGATLYVVNGRISVTAVYRFSCRGPFSVQLVSQCGLASSLQQPQRPYLFVAPRPHDEIKNNTTQALQAVKGGVVSTTTSEHDGISPPRCSSLGSSCLEVVLEEYSQQLQHISLASERLEWRC